MKYMLLMHAPRGTGEYGAARWTPEDLKAHVGFMRRLDRDLAASGEMVSNAGLAPPGEARTVRAGEDGAPAVADGFPAAKEFLVGFWIVDVDRPERAYEIAGLASAAPGPGGAPLRMPIEVRRLASAPPVDA